ncbi:MAG: hypothetical protein K0Q53_1897 [Massilibacillus sp.]|nr:hypothetical protein [Massilibacillus sp.]
MKVILTTLNAKYTHSSLAIRYLKEYCKTVCEVEIQEFSINNGILDILSQLFEVKPDIIGFACYIWNIEMTMKLVNLLKKVLPNITIICGGPEVSYQPEGFFRENPSIDYIIQGEGEETLYHLLTQLKLGRTMEDIPALTYYNEENQIVSSNAVVVKNLDTIPFPYHDEDIIALKDKIIYYESSRGCPFSCQYCLSSATQGVRFFSIDRVLDELRFFIRHNVRQVKFVDRTFNAKKSHYMQILKFLVVQKCKTNFHFEIAADLLDAEVLDILELMPVGRVQLEIGVQSTNEVTLDNICRTNNWNKIVHNVTRILSFDNIHLHLDLIIGLPNEDYKSFQKSFNDVYSLKPHMLQIGFLKLLKGSGISLNRKKHGYVFMDIAPYQVLANDYMSYEEVRKLHILEEIFEQYYNSGRFRNSTQFLIALKGGNAFIFYDALTEYWQKRGLHLVAHTTKSLYKYLYEFCEEKYPEKAEVLKEILKFDALLSDKAGIRPDFLDWNEEKYNNATSYFWREKGAEQYLDQYKFTTWRDIKKKYHIEVFKIDIVAFMKTKKLVTANLPVLFFFAEDVTTYQVIKEKDFWQGEV